MNSLCTKVVLSFKHKLDGTRLPDGRQAAGPRRFQLCAPFVERMSLRFAKTSSENNLLYIKAQPELDLRYSSNDLALAFDEKAI